MSVEQYQRMVNSLDKEIADLEKKKADVDKKVADAQKRESSVSIPNNASSSTIKTKMRQIENYHSQAVKAATDRAALAKRIAEKRSRRNEAAVRLQREEQRIQKQQENSVKQVRQSYERQINELQARLTESLSIPKIANEPSAAEYDVFVSPAWEDKEDSLIESSILLESWVFKFGMIQVK